MLDRLIVSAKAHLPQSTIDVLRELRHRGRGLRYVVFPKLGYRLDQWARVVQIDEWKAFLTELPLARLQALEISPGDKTIWRQIGFGSYTAVDFPTFDITTDTLPCVFDIIIAEQVFEHLRHPYTAARNIRTMLKDDGIFLIATPFLIRVHGMPRDYTRWTPDGLSGFLEDCGFHAEVHSWGSRKAVIANFNRWAEFGFGRSLRNEPDFPAVVWAYARKKST
jgi:SAM-dependent methyltransferase